MLELEGSEPYRIKNSHEVSWKFVECRASNLAGDVPDLFQ